MKASVIKEFQAKGTTTLPKGQALLNNSLLNKGTAFTERERDALGLRGLLPPHVCTIEQQVQRVMGNLRRKADPLEKYIFLTTLQNRNETLFYRVLVDHIEELMPIIYTPTVGQACLEYGAIFRRPRGLYVSIRDRGRVAEILRHWPQTDVRIIVVTDGERILGLGDLGALGMGIPIGKLSLYTACAGVHFSYTLPVMLDVGTDNEKLHDDPMYIGLHQKRVRGAEYDDFLDEFINAVKNVFPRAILQWEDFGNAHAFHLLNRYQEKICSFNDDIQGTASVAVGGIIAALQLTGGQLRNQKLVFLGAGEAGTGIADLFVEAAQQEGLSQSEARALCWFVDSQGLVCSSRLNELSAHKRPYAHDHPFLPTLDKAIEKIRPTILIGVSGSPGKFTESIISRMAQINQRPVIFALSNPTSKAECTAQQAYEFSQGRAIFASGSPFPPVTYQGKVHVPGQGNNVYIFPGVGLGLLVSAARCCTSKIFLRAAQTLASLVRQHNLSRGSVYPDLSRIREISLEIAIKVTEEVYHAGLSEKNRPEDIRQEVLSCMYQPEYMDYA